MTIELDEKSYIVGMWFSSCPKTNNDWLACVVRDPENPEGFKGWSRFRYANGDKIWDNDDKKRWYTIRCENNISEDDVIEMMEKALHMPEAYPFKDKIIVRGSLRQLMELAKGKSWMNMKVASVEKNDH